MNVSNRHPGPFAAIGLLAAFAFAIVLIVAINGDSAWVYGENMLSDLGISDVQMTADLFNYGCMIVGILVFVYGLGKAVCETQCNRASGCVLAIAAIFLVLIGYIHSDFGNGNTHDTIATLFFLFLFIAMVLSAIGDWRDGARLNSALTVVLILIILGCAVGMTVEALEVITVACGIVWLAEMTPVPEKMVFGAALGLIGGIIAMCAIAAAWDGTLDSMPLVGLNLLVACMFFAVAGGFTKYTPVQGSTILVLAAVCEAVVILSILYEGSYLWLNLVLAAIGVANILIAACPTVTTWVDAQRI